MSAPSATAPRFPRVLVTGAAGFVGRHLVRELASAGHEVLTTDALPPDAPAAAGLPGYAQADLRDAAAVRSLLRAARPDGVIHLAAVSFVPDGARDPALALTVNVGGTLALAEGILAEVPAARLLFVSTAQVYGTTRSDVPLREETGWAPRLSLDDTLRAILDRKSVV